MGWDYFNPVKVKKVEKVGFAVHRGGMIAGRLCFFEKRGRCAVQSVTERVRCGFF